MVKRMKWLLAALSIASGAIAATTVKQEASLEVGRRAYEASEYAKAIQALQAAAAADPKNGDVQLLLASYARRPTSRLASCLTVVAAIAPLAMHRAASSHFIRLTIPSFRENQNFGRNDG